MQIIDEYDYLIHLIYCAMHNVKPKEKPESMQFENVLLCGIGHEVAQFAYPSVIRLQNGPDEDVLRRWHEAYYCAIIRNAKQEQAKAEILSDMHKCGIHTLELQGTEVKKYYPQPELRMMSDIDFIIPVEKLQEAKRVMQSLGYTANERLSGNAIDAQKNQIFVELHTDFFKNGHEMGDILHDWKSYVVKCEDYKDEVSKTIFYLYHLLHDIKHLHWKGIGIRRIIDLYYLEEALRDNIDNAYIAKVMKESGLQDDMVKLLALMRFWFWNEDSDVDILPLAHEVKAAGKHGTIDISIDRYAQNKKSIHFIKIRYFFSRIFLSKETIYQSYPVCKKNHFPLVICWVYRVCSFAFVKEQREKLRDKFSDLKRAKYKR